MGLLRLQRLLQCLVVDRRDEEFLNQLLERFCTNRVLKKGDCGYCIDR